MINTKDLMIGNILLWNGKKYKVAYFFSDVIALDISEEFGEGAVQQFQYNQIHSRDISELSGVPITQEILLKLGFKEMKPLPDSIHVWSDYELNGVIIELPYFEFKWNYTENSIAIKYIHTLQNIYKLLTCEDLDVSKI